MLSINVFWIQLSLTGTYVGIHLQAKEFSTDFTVSPPASVCWKSSNWSPLCDFFGEAHGISNGLRWPMFAYDSFLQSSLSNHWTIHPGRLNTFWGSLWTGHVEPNGSWNDTWEVKGLQISCKKTKTKCMSWKPFATQTCSVFGVAFETLHQNELLHLQLLWATLLSCMTLHPKTAKVGIEKTRHELQEAMRLCCLRVELWTVCGAEHSQGKIQHLGDVEDTKFKTGLSHLFDSQRGG